MKSNKGITLVALVITIIVLLILAGVSISLVVGDNGVLTQAQNASQKTDLASAKSALEMTLTSITSEFLGNVWEDNTSAKIFENVKVSDLDKELQNNGFYIVKFGGTTTTGANATKDGMVSADPNTGTTAADAKSVVTDIVIAEGEPGENDHSNTDDKGKAINTTYKTTLTWSERSVKITGSWTEGEEKGTKSST